MPFSVYTHIYNVAPAALKCRPVRVCKYQYVSVKNGFAEAQATNQAFPFTGKKSSGRKETISELF